MHSASAHLSGATLRDRRPWCARADALAHATRGVPDDCNSFAVNGNQTWLRTSRIGQAFAFHASTDGRLWQFIRHFSLPTSDPIDFGFVAQSPTGAGCTVRFDDIHFRAERLA